jgi:hypothetical protein
MSSEQAELQQAVRRARRTVKGLLGQLRATTQILADLDERLALVVGADPTAEEAQDHEHEPRAVAVR